MAFPLPLSSPESNLGHVSGSDSSGSSKSTDVSSSKNLRKKSTVKQQLEHGQSAHRPIPTKAPNKPLGSRASKTDNNEYYKEEDSRTPGSSDRKSDSEFIPKDTSYEDDNGIYPCQKNSHKGRRSLEVSNNRPKNRANEVDGSGSPVSKEGTEEVVGDPSGTISEIRKVFNNGQPVERLVNYPELEEALTHFKENFIPYLQNNENKVWQAKAEIKNLKHISNCADYMLNNIEFKPEFVAKIAATRLDMAMFGAGNFQNQGNGTLSKDYGKIMTVEDGYQPSCMWDFGEDRTTINLTGISSEEERYKKEGRLQSPTPPGIKIHNNFSALRGIRDKERENYVMPGGRKRTPCLSNRFQQYLRVRDGIPEFGPGMNESIENFLCEPCAEEFLVENGIKKGSKQISTVKTFLEKFMLFHNGRWKTMNNGTRFSQLPFSLMMPIGIQFGQKYRGTNNPFTVAAQKYFSLQYKERSPDSFAWHGNKVPEALLPNAPNIAENAFEEIYSSCLQSEGDFSRAYIMESLEKGLCAYYAMTQEVLSRTNFPGNDTNRIEAVFRLEDTDAVKAMGIVKKKEMSYACNDSFDPSKAKRLVLASTSLAAPLASLDNANDFPPPIKIITKYENVHHACIFGCHLFNADRTDAQRRLENFLVKNGNSDKVEVGTYADGCPFYNDRQRECLTLLNGLKFEVVGVLIVTTHPQPSYVLSGEGRENLGVELIEEKAVEQYAVKRQAEFCLRDSNETVEGMLGNHTGKDMPVLQEMHSIIRCIVKKYEFKHLLRRS